VSKDSDQTETAPNGEQAPMVYPGKEKRELRASDYVEPAMQRVTARSSGAADDLRLADEWEAQARTKQLPSTQTEIGAGGELIDREKVGSHLFDTVAHPDYVTAEASRDRLRLANQAGSLRLWRTLLPAAVLDPSGQASPAERQPCRTAGARFTAARVRGRGRRRA
jgi:hypothetical protein